MKTGGHIWQKVIYKYKNPQTSISIPIVYPNEMYTLYIIYIMHIYVYI